MISLPCVTSTYKVEKQEPVDLPSIPLEPFRRSKILSNLPLPTVMSGDIMVVGAVLSLGIWQVFSSLSLGSSVAHFELVRLNADKMNP